jgi:hypothetical protein
VGRPGHISNVDHGVVPESCVEKAIDVVKCVKEFQSNKEKVIRQKGLEYVQSGFDSRSEASDEQTTADSGVTLTPVDLTVEEMSCLTCPLYH